MKLSKSIPLYTVANVINKGLVFLLIPILTKYISPFEYGTLSLFTTSLLFITPLITLQISSAINVEYYKSHFDKENFPLYLSSAISIAFTSFVIFLILSISLKGIVSSSFEVPSYTIWFLPIIALFTTWIEVFKNILIVKKKPLNFGIFIILFTISDFAITYYFLVDLELSFYGRILGIFYSKFLFSIIAIFYLIKDKLLIFKIENKYILDILNYSLPLIPHSIGLIIIHSSDQFFINNMIGKQELGIYSVAYTIGAAIMLLDISFNQAFTPYLFEQLSDINHKKKMRIVMYSYIYAGCLIFIGIVLCFLAPYIYYYFIEQKYHSGIKYVPIIVCSYIFLGFYKIFTNYLFFLKKTKLIAALTVICAIITLLLNYCLISVYGTIGAAYATFTAFLLFFILYSIVANKYYPMPWFSFNKRS